MSSVGSVSPSQVYRLRKHELQDLAKSLGMKETTGLKRNELADQIRNYMNESRGVFQDVTRNVTNVSVEDEEDYEDKENKSGTKSNNFFESISNATKSFSQTFLPPYKTMDAMIDLEFKAKLARANAQHAFKEDQDILPHVEGASDILLEKPLEVDVGEETEPSFAVPAESVVESTNVSVAAAFVANNNNSNNNNNNDISLFTIKDEIFSSSFAKNPALLASQEVKQRNKLNFWQKGATFMANPVFISILCLFVEFSVLVIKNSVWQTSIMTMPKAVISEYLPFPKVSLETLETSISLPLLWDTLNEPSEALQSVLKTWLIAFGLVPWSIAMFFNPQAKQFPLGSPIVFAVARYAVYYVSLMGTFHSIFASLPFRYFVVSSMAIFIYGLLGILSK